MEMAQKILLDRLPEGAKAYVLDQMRLVALEAIPCKTHEQLEIIDF